MTETTKTILSEATRAAIDNWAKRYPADQRQSAVLEALRIVQHENNGWLTVELMNAVADYLGMSKIAVYEVVSFYSMFNAKPVGRNVIDVCTNISCMLRDSKKIVDHLKKRLEVNVGETTLDGRFTLRTVECLAACTNAPVMQIGKKYHENLTTEKVDAIIEELE